MVVGRQGPPGERGMQGDHGQPGEKGERGEKGATRNRAVVGYVILSIAVCGAFFATWDNARKVEAARAERIAQLNEINRKQCAALRNLYVVIQQTLVASDKRIDQISYYRSHPTERIRAHRENVAIIRRFALPPCPQKIALVK